MHYLRSYSFGSYLYRLVREYSECKLDIVINATNAGFFQLIGIDAAQGKIAFGTEGHQEVLMRIIRSLSREKRITSVLAIHDLNFSAANSDRIVILHDGKIFARGKPAAMFTADIVEMAFGILVKGYDHHGVPHVVVRGDRHHR